MRHVTVKRGDLGDDWTAEAHVPAVPEDVATLARSLGREPESWRHNCHIASLAIVKSGIYPGARVARGFARGVTGQHSWVVADGGCYDLDAHIIDPTLWSYDTHVTGVWQGTLRDGVHHPHGEGHFMTAGMPYHHGGDTIHLVGDAGESGRRFLRSIGAPFDAHGWMQVAHLPVEGWPAREVIEAMLDTPQLSVLVPIDIVGMLTDRNPNGLYLVGAEGRW